jgi:release factor glutamine methyltransferase
MTTIQERVAAARQTLRNAGIGPVEAEISARMLALHVLGWDTTRYLTRAAEAEPSGFASTYDAAVERRASREPSAYITGRREFWGLPLEVSPAVLIPRAETELIVEAALELMSAQRQQRLRVADACTGSGNLAIALAHELPQASIVATDISEAALAVAQRNAQRHDVADRIRFVHTDVLTGVDGPFDLIVGNPPYVRQGDRPALQPEVRDHEPSVALFGGAIGTELVAAMVEQGAARLKAGGYLLFEFGCGQDVAVEELIAAAPDLRLLGLRRDLQGIARTAVARRA